MVTGRSEIAFEPEGSSGRGMISKHAWDWWKLCMNYRIE